MCDVYGVCTHVWCVSAWCVSVRVVWCMYVVVCVCCGVCWPKMLLAFRPVQPTASGTGQPEAPLLPGEGGGSAGTRTWVGTGTQQSRECAYLVAAREGVAPGHPGIGRSPSEPRPPSSKPSSSLFARHYGFLFLSLLLRRCCAFFIPARCSQHPFTPRRPTLRCFGPMPPGSAFPRM